MSRPDKSPMAVRTTNIDGMDITQGDIMAIGDGGMLAVEKTIPDAR